MHYSQGVIVLRHRCHSASYQRITIMCIFTYKPFLFPITTWEGVSWGSQAIRHEKRCDPVILDRGQILGEMWTFLPKTMRHFDKSGICGFWQDKIHKSKYLWLIWLYFYLWIGSELSTNIYMIERKVPFS